MKKKRKITKCLKVFSVTLVVMITGVGAMGKRVQAGSNDVTLDAGSFAEELDITKWNNPDADIEIADGKMIFTEKSTGDTRVITQKAATVCEQNDTLLSGTYTIKFTSLPEGKRFILGFGLQSIESLYEETGSVELCFQNENGVKTSVIAYDENGDLETLVESRSCGVTLGKLCEVSVHIASDMRCEIAINGQTIYSEQSPVSLEGRMGFLQTGSCEVEISDINMTIYKYETPENCDVIENFESGTINVNTLTSKMVSSCSYYPSGIQVEEYNGSNVLMFRNVSCGYIGTTYRYSNFELTFDVPWYLHSGETREDGSMKSPACAGFAVAYGADAQDFNFFGFESAADALVFSNKLVYRYSDTKSNVYFNDHNFFDVKENEGYSVRLTVIDTNLTLALKALDSNEWVEMLSYKIGESTPTGYISIWTTGQANFAIDNLSIVNKDDGAKLVEVEYQSGLVPEEADWEYQPVDAPYLVESEKKSDNFIIYIPLAGAIIVGTILVVGSLVITKVRKGPKKEGESDEIESC